MVQKIATLVIGVIGYIFICCPFVAAEEVTRVGYTDIAGEATSIRQEITDSNDGLQESIAVAALMLGSGVLAVQQFRAKNRVKSD